MKKFAAGCLIVVVLLAVCGGTEGYWLYSKARSCVGQFQALEKLDKNVTNIAAFAAPVNGELSEDGDEPMTMLDATFADVIAA